MSEKPLSDQSHPGVISAHEYDFVSETGSETLASQKICTPTSSSTCGMSATDVRMSSDDEEDEPVSEQAPLLSDNLPQYEKIQAEKGASVVEEIEYGECTDRLKPPCGLDGEPSCSRQGRRCRRKRAGRICFFVVVKLFLFFWTMFVLSMLFRFPLPWSHWREGLHACTPTDHAISSPSGREIVVDNGRRSIWGRYPLFDLLSLSTTSGSIAVTIIPQQADPEKPDEPARLFIRSKSGSITLSFIAPRAASLPESEKNPKLAELGPEAIFEHKQEEAEVEDKPGRGRSRRRKSKPMKKSGCHGKKKNKGFFKSQKHDCDTFKDVAHDFDKSLVRPLPPRPYEIDIETQSGSISGRILFSSSVNLATGSGSIRAMLVPVVYPESPSNVSIKTVTVSGNQHIRLAEPFILPSGVKERRGSQQTATVNYPTASHVSTGPGSMRISYPRNWAGEVHAQAENGRICLDGKGLNVNKKGDGYAHGSKDAVKDDEAYNWWGGRSDMNVSLVSEGSGSVLFVVG